MTTTTRVRILAISGSLRQASSSGVLIESAARVAPAGVQVCVYPDLAKLPPFNPDLERHGAPRIVVRFRGLLRASDAVLIASPEYAQGVPGVLKNALDWIVRSHELRGKPTALMCASTHATHAWASLAKTLTAMWARVIPEASITLPIHRLGLDADGVASHPELSQWLLSAIEALVTAVREVRAA